MPQSGIYQLRNVITGEIYIGHSRNFKDREHRHFRSLRRGYHANKLIQEAYNKYGKDAFVFEILEETDRDFIVKEQDWIDKLGPEYNIHQIAYDNFPEYSQQSRDPVKKEIARQEFIKMAKDPDRIEKTAQWHRGRKRPESTRQKQRDVHAARKQKKQDEEKGA